MARPQYSSNFGLPAPVQPRVIHIPASITKQFNSGTSVTLAKTPSRTNQLIAATSHQSTAAAGMPIQTGWIWTCLVGIGPSLYLGKPDPTLPTSNSTTVQFQAMSGFPNQIIYEIVGQPLVGEVLSYRSFISNGPSSFAPAVVRPYPGPSIVMVAAMCASGGAGFDGTNSCPRGWVIDSFALGGIAFSKGPTGPTNAVSWGASGGRNWTGAVIQVR